MSVKIFFCYAHVDEDLLMKLKRHLSPLLNQGLIDVWHDRDINAGSEWEQEIKEQLNSAQIILLLVSPDFMASNYINNVELKRAIERHQRGEAWVIPVILRYVYWQGEPLGKLQALPKDGKPVKSWTDVDEAFFDVTEGIRKVVERLGTKPLPTPKILPSQASKRESEAGSHTILSPQPAKPLPSLQHYRIVYQRYRIVEQLGERDMATVYKAEDINLWNAQYAIKEMSQSGLKTQKLLKAIQTFEQEAKLLTGLGHPNLPRIYDYFNENWRWYLVMDYIEGETLESRLEKAPNGKLSVRDVLAVGLQLCTVLDYLHTRQPPIIFRFLKPSYIMLTQNEHLYLINFGISRLFKPGKTRDTGALGAPGYAAPEQIGRAQTTSAADIYSLGAILHQMLSGNDPTLNPFHFAPLSLGTSYSDLGQLILRMVELDRDKRPSSIREIEQVLQRSIIQQ